MHSCRNALVSQTLSPIRFSHFWGSPPPSLSLSHPSRSARIFRQCCMLQNTNTQPYKKPPCWLSRSHTQTHSHTDARTKTRFVVSFKLILAFFMCTAFSTSRRVSPSSSATALHFSSPFLLSPLLCSLLLVSILRPRPAFLVVFVVLACCNSLVGVAVIAIVVVLVSLWVGEGWL